MDKSFIDFMSSMVVLNEHRIILNHMYLNSTKSHGFTEFYSQQNGLSKKNKIRKGNNKSFNITNRIVPNMPKISAKTVKTKANTKAKGVKIKIMKTNNNFRPIISNSIAMKISMIVLE